MVCRKIKISIAIYKPLRLLCFATKEAVPQLLLALKISLLFGDLTLYLGFFLL
jgi:hypothetical protein